MSNVKQVIAAMNALPDISAADSERLKEFTRVTSREIKLVGCVSAAITLDTIGYIRELEHKLRELGVEL